MRDVVERRLALGLLATSCVLLGGLMGAAGIPPFPSIWASAKETRDLVNELRQTRPTVLKPLRRPGHGVVAARPDKIQPGLTLVQGILPGGNQIVLVDSDGTVKHRWETDFFEIWPDAEEVFPPSRLPKSENHYFVQGMAPLRDGSIVVVFGGLGAVRLDRCSQPIWRTDRQAHHSVTPTDDGKFWIPGHIPTEETPPSYLPRGISAAKIESMLNPRYEGYNNSVMLVDADGRVEREISVLSAIFEAGLEHAIYASLHDTVFDPTHLNDIEIVTSALADRIDGVEQGDLLLSIRDMHMLAVIDEVTGELKWYHQGPWVRQHDPDITEDGTIELFNNRSKLISMDVEASQIVAFDPVTKVAEVISPTGEDVEFFSDIMGTHQLLPNGNRLIAESTAGRIIELTSQGEIVWDYRLPFDDEVASLISEAMRVPNDFFEVGSLRCS